MCGSSHQTIETILEQTKKKKKKIKATGNLLENASNFTNDTLLCLDAFLNCWISVEIRARM